MHITEEILQRTDLELQNGKLTEETIWLWWNQNEPPPEDKDDFDETAERVRKAHRDTIALYRLIGETCDEGFDCELQVSWDGDQNNPIYETFLVHVKQEPIDVDFQVVWNEAMGKVLLYRFVAS